jgi:hypothetical protein
MFAFPPNGRVALLTTISLASSILCFIWRFQIYRRFYWWGRLRDIAVILTVIGLILGDLLAVAM